MGHRAPKNALCCFAHRDGDTGLIIRERPRIVGT
jgi:hypothetical protein